jgi:hypothetical protein
LPCLTCGRIVWRPRSCRSHYPKGAADGASRLLNRILRRGVGCAITKSGDRDYAGRAATRMARPA